MAEEFLIFGMFAGMSNVSSICLPYAWRLLSVMSGFFATGCSLSWQLLAWECVLSDRPVSTRADFEHFSLVAIAGRV